MIKLEKTQVIGWEHSIRGMRNPLNSWSKSDTRWSNVDYGDHVESMVFIGSNDHDLMMRLSNSGSDHAKYRRMIVVYVDITAPLYWWKEFDTYKVGTVANSCSTMFKIHDKEFTLDDFSHEHLCNSSLKVLDSVIKTLNIERNNFMLRKENEADCKYQWWQMIQLLPSSYNQKRTIMLNYEVLNNMYHSRKNHKLNEWHDFCDWIKTLPYSEIIVGGE